MDTQLKSQIADISIWLGSGSINIFGLPFSGKDTHGSELAKFLNGKLISGGDILRSARGLQDVKDRIARGFLAPTGEFLATVLPYLSDKSLQDRPLILSSIGRWHGEEESVIAAAEASSHPLKAVIYLSVNQDDVHKRWELAERGRQDDEAKHILENRFKEFEKKTLPVIEYYRNHGLCIEIDATAPRKQVMVDIINKLHTFLRPKG